MILTSTPIFLQVKFSISETNNPKFDQAEKPD